MHFGTLQRVHYVTNRYGLFWMQNQRTIILNASISLLIVSVKKHNKREESFFRITGEYTQIEEY